MTRKPLSNIAQSVRARLLKHARETGRPFQELLQLYGMERFQYRLSRSQYRDKLVLKGALMLMVWRSSISRPTLDIDFLGRMANDRAILENSVREICAVPVADDGVAFEPESVSIEDIVEGADYHGIRVQFRGKLDTAVVHMQLDIGFGDAVIPGPVEIEYPALLNFPAPTLLGYTIESAVAEKVEAIVKLGVPNSRMKDFYDIWLLSRQSAFDGKSLSAAISATFGRRGTPLSASPAAFTADFTENRQKQTQWTAFVNKNGIENAPRSIKGVVAELQLFLDPALSRLSSGGTLFAKWAPGGPWEIQAE